MLTLISDVGVSTRGIWMAPDTKAAKPFADKITRDFADIDSIIAEVKGGLFGEELTSFEKVLAAYAPFVIERKEIARVGAEAGPAQALALANSGDGVAQMV